jgi:phage tail-like protein
MSEQAATRRANFPLPVFNFEVVFEESRLHGSNEGVIPLCGGSFSECTGLEATMEPKAIKAGGNNYGAIQRVGPVSFATVILKRGMTRRRDLWRWFEMTSQGGAYSYRLKATIHMRDARGESVVAWQLKNAMPVKFKASDLNAKGSDVGVEELHIVHEGLSMADAASAPSLDEEGR